MNQKIVKSTQLVAEVDESRYTCRADRNIGYDGKEQLSIQVHLLKAGGANAGGMSGTINARNYEEMEVALAQFGEALRRLRAADQA